VNLLLVTQYFWPESFRINEVVASLSQRGEDVVVLTGKPNYPEGKLFPGYRVFGCHEESYCKAKILRLPLLPRGNKSVVRLALNYLSFIVFGLICGPWLLRGQRPEVVLVYCPSPLLQVLPALFIGWLKRAPVVVYVQDLWPESLEATGYVSNRWIIGFVRTIVKFIYRHSDLILVSCRPFEESIRSLAPESRIAYYPNSVDASFCNPDAGTKPALPVLDSGFNIVFAGNIGSAQAVQVIIEAAALLKDYPEIRFVVLGSGSEFEWMQEQIREHQLLNVHLAGRFPVDAMPYLLSKASGLLVTLADRPIFAATVPNKIQAYMAVGRPIVACLNGEGARLVKEAEAGLTVPAEDATKLAEAVLALYRMPREMREMLGANGRAYYHAHFDHEKLVSELMGHLRDVAGSTP
jgi:glycosyltransferase involved in cell wall biosynthesis